MANIEINRFFMRVSWRDSKTRESEFGSPFTIK